MSAFRHFTDAAIALWHEVTGMALWFFDALIEDEYEDF